MPKGIYNRITSKPRPSCSDETKKKIGNGNRGKKMSEEQKKKLSLANRGKRHSLETRIKIGKGHTGEKHYLYGKHMSENTKKKLSEGHKLKGIIPPSQKGVIQTYEQRVKKSGSNSAIWKEKNPNWKGGTTEKNATLRSSFEYKQWRSDVFKRDNWTCQTCRIRGNYLEAHHIKRWVNYPELRFVVDNGVTLCKQCHSLTKGGNSHDAEKNAV